MSVCLLYVLAWQLPESKFEQHVEVTVTHAGKKGWVAHGGWETDAGAGTKQRMFC